MNSLSARLAVPLRWSAGLLAAVLCSIPFTVTADSEDCGLIASNEERLACYDREYRSTRMPAAEPAASTPANLPGQVRKPEAVPPVSIKEATAAPAARQRDQVEQKPTVADVVPAAAESEPKDSRKWLSFGRKEKPKKSSKAEPEQIAATVTDATKLWPSGRWKYTLDNGQQWAQTKAKNLFIKEGTRVTVTKNFVTYRLESEGGASTKVERVD